VASSIVRTYCGLVSTGGSIVTHLEGTKHGRL